MSSGYYFDISAFVILLCLIYAFFLESMQKILENDIVLVSILCELLASFIGVLRGIPPFSGPEYVGLLNLTSDMLTASGIALLVLFVYRISVYNIGLIRYLAFVWVPLGLDVILCGLAVFGKLPWARTAAFFCDAYMLFAGLNILVVYKKNSSLERTLMLMLTFAAASVFTVVEAFVPEIRMQNFALALLLGEEFFSLRNPDEQYDINTGLLGEEAFRESLRRRLFYLDKHKSEKVYLVMLAIHGSETFMKLFGDVNEIKLRKNVIDELTRIANGVLVFRLRQGLYVYMVDEEGMGEALRIQGDLNDRFKGTFGKDAYEMEMHASTSLIELPKMADTLPAVLDLLYMAAKEGLVKDKKVVDAGKLDSGHEAYMREVDEKVRNAVSRVILRYITSLFILLKKNDMSLPRLLSDCTTVTNSSRPMFSFL